jgi:hypothetical protein
MAERLGVGTGPAYLFARAAGQNGIEDRVYPDPLLAQVLAASTFPDQIPEAAKWADEHHYLTRDGRTWAT